MSTYKVKQEWLEAVMASKTLGAATKIYAYGIFKHMYGNKDNAFPGAKAIKAATGLADGKFYLHNKALAKEGFLEVTHRRGKSNEYVLSYPPTEEVGTTPQKGYDPPTEEVTPTPFVGTNTTSNTSKDTSMEDNNTTTVPDGPVDLEADAVREEEASITSLNYVKEVQARNETIRSKAIYKTEAERRARAQRILEDEKRRRSEAV